MENRFLEICQTLDIFFKKFEDEIKPHAYFAYLGIKEVLGENINTLSSFELKDLVDVCMDKCGFKSDIYEFSASIATAIYVDKILTIEDLKDIPDYYCSECFDEDRIDRLEYYKQDKNYYNSRNNIDRDER